MRYAVVALLLAIACTAAVRVQATACYIRILNDAAFDGESRLAADLMTTFLSIADAADVRVVRVGKDPSDAALQEPAAAAQKAAAVESYDQTSTRVAAMIHRCAGPDGVTKPVVLNMHAGLQYGNWFFKSLMRKVYDLRLAAANAAHPPVPLPAVKATVNVLTCFVTAAKDDVDIRTEAGFPAEGAEGTAYVAWFKASVAYMPHQEKDEVLHVVARENKEREMVAAVIKHQKTEPGYDYQFCVNDIKNALLYAWKYGASDETTILKALDVATQIRGLILASSAQEQKVAGPWGSTDDADVAGRITKLIAAHDKAVGVDGFKLDGAWKKCVGHLKPAAKDPKAKVSGLKPAEKKAAAAADEKYRDVFIWGVHELDLPVAFPSLVGHTKAIKSSERPDSDAWKIPYRDQIKSVKATAAGNIADVAFVAVAADTRAHARVPVPAAAPTKPSPAAYRRLRADRTRTANNNVLQPREQH